MKAAIYVRESSSDTQNSPPIEQQIERGKHWVQYMGHELVKIYIDNGYSGGNWNRPDWNQCIKDAKRHNFQILWVWNQDRIARDTEQFLNFYRQMKSAGCKIYEDTANEYIDMETMGGRVKYQSLAQAAEIYRLVTSDKVKQAYQRKKDKTKWGRPPIPLDMEKIAQMRTDGLGWRTIAHEFNCSHNTIRNAIKALKNRVISEQSEKS
jgi:site-specific DNA recombinase